MIASAMNILFEEFLKLKIEEPFGIFFAMFEEPSGMRVHFLL
jgi:hypothetical protein